MEKIILHCDLNNFFASCECLDNPDYLNIPIAVVGDPAKRSGIILAKNQPAKKAGIKTGDVIWQAKTKCPDLLCIPAHHSKYAYWSKFVKQIYLKYTNKVESFGIDECWLDVSASTKLFGSGYEIAQKIKKEVKESTGGLTVSIGVSFSKMYAKLGSDMNKPDAITQITKDNYKDLIYPMLAKNLIFVGRKRAKQLEKLNILTIGDLAAADDKILLNHFGINGRYLKQITSGTEPDEVADIDNLSEIKSVGNGTTTITDIKNFDEAKQVIYFLSDSVATRLRQINREAFCVSIDMRLSDLDWMSHSKTLTKSTDNDKEIAETAFRLLKSNFDFDTNQNRIRALRVACSHLVTNKQNCQLSLFNNFANDEKNKKRDKNIDSIRKKYGYQSIKRGLMLTKNNLIKTEIFDDLFDN